MRNINWRRVVLGGVLAGVVLMALAAASTAVFGGHQMLRSAMRSLRPSISGTAAIPFILGAFVLLGMLMTWWYAALRPLFGPGPKTAAIAGGAVWLTAFGLGVVGFALKNVVLDEPYWLPSGPMLPLVFLVIMVAGTVAGASVYKEQQA